MSRFRIRENFILIFKATLGFCERRGCWGDAMLHPSELCPKCREADQAKRLAARARLEKAL